MNRLDTMQQHTHRGRIERDKKKPVPSSMCILFFLFYMQYQIESYSRKSITSYIGGILKPLLAWIAGLPCMLQCSIELKLVCYCRLKEKLFLFRTRSLDNERSNNYNGNKNFKHLTIDHITFNKTLQWNEEKNNNNNNAAAAATFRSFRKTFQFGFHLSRSEKECPHLYQSSLCFFFSP